jgi:hypothetical protein
MKKLPDYILRRLPRHHWKLLRDVPTWEGVLYYDPLDFELDRPLTFYRRLYCWQLHEEIIYPMWAHESDVNRSHRKRGSKRKPMYRRWISFKWQPNLLFGKDQNKVLYCHQLTMLCWMGFAIADPRHWVVDHIDGNPLNDRPSNLQVISQSENCRRSEKVREQARKTQKIAAELSRGLSNQQRHEAALKRRAERAKQIASIHQDMERDIEVELEMAIDDL